MSSLEKEFFFFNNDIRDYLINFGFFLIKKQRRKKL